MQRHGIRRIPSWMAALGLLAAAGCARAPEPAPDAASSLSFETQRFEETLRDCPEHLAPCASIVLEFPVLPADAPPDVAAALAAFVDTTVLAPIDEGGGAGAGTPQALTEQFLAGYREFAETFPEAPGGWSLQRIARPIWTGPAGFSLEFREESYTGGAHPNSIVRLVSFDGSSGLRVRLEDLIPDEHREAVRALAEAAFRDVHGLEATADLTAAGFWFEDGRFRLNDNFAVTGEGLRFHFNPYEVAPYALGPTDLTIPRASLAGLVRANGWLDVLGPI